MNIEQSTANGLRFGWSDEMSGNVDDLNRIELLSRWWGEAKNEVLYAEIHQWMNGTRAAMLSVLLGAFVAILLLAVSASILSSSLTIESTANIFMAGSFSITFSTNSGVTGVK